MTVISGTFTIDEVFKWPPCTYCENEGFLLWDGSGTQAQWLCRHHAELQQSGWLDLVVLVTEAVNV